MANAHVPKERVVRALAEVVLLSMAELLPDCDDPGDRLFLLERGFSFWLPR